MLPALAAALLPVALGILLAMTPGLRQASSGTAHRVVLAMATAVVLLLVLPEAVSSIGWHAFAVFAAALLVPTAVERLSGHDHDHDAETSMDVELGFAGMVLHQLVEGGGLGAVFATGEQAWLVAGAVALHTVPLIAAVVHGCTLRVGTRAGLVRGLLLALATGIGVPIGELAASSLDEIKPWVGAAVGGLLLHALWHAWQGPGHHHEGGA